MSVTCDLAPSWWVSMTVVCNSWLLVKKLSKTSAHIAGSHRKLQGIRQVMQSTLLGQFQQFMLSLTLSAAVIFSFYFIFTSGNPGCNQRFLFTLRSMRVGPVSNPGWTLRFPGLKFSTRVGLFLLIFLLTLSPSTQDVGQTSSSVNTTLVTVLLTF